MSYLNSPLFNFRLDSERIAERLWYVLFCAAVLTLALWGWLGYTTFIAPRARSSAAALVSHAPASIEEQVGAAYFLEGKNAADPARTGVKKVAFIAQFDTVSMQRLTKAYLDTFKTESPYATDHRIFNTHSDPMLARSSVEEALKEGCDILVTGGTQASQLAKEIREKRESLVPQVFVGTGDPLLFGLADTIENPGHGMTGASCSGYQWMSDLLHKITTLFPRIKKIMIPYYPAGFGGMLDMFAERFSLELEKRGMSCELVQVYKQSDITERLDRFSEGDFDGILLLPDAKMLDNFALIQQVAERLRVPTFISFNISQIHKGAVMAYGYEDTDVGIAGARQVLKAFECRHAEDVGSLSINTLNSNYGTVVNLDNGVKQGIDRWVDQELLFIMQYGDVITGRHINGGSVGNHETILERQ